MILATIVKDLEKAGAAVVHEVEALPSQIEHGLLNLFRLIAKDLSPAALKAAVGLAEHYVGVLLPQAQGLVEGAVVTLADPIEHTQAFEWVKGELLANGVVSAVPDAHVLASMAWALVNKGVSVVEQHITAAETQALVDAAKP